MVRKIFLLIFCALSFACLSAQGQDVNVRGRVVDENGNPAVGAAVMLVGADNIGVITDVEGKFTITAPSGGVLQISYLGYKTQEVNVAARVDVALEPDSEALEAATISTGMTNVDRRLFTGASDRLMAEDMMLGGVADVSRSLEGRAAGVSVQNVSSTFGTAPKIRVRGATSILGNSKPLWVVDGVIIEDVTEVNTDELSSGDAITMVSSAIAGLNSDDIESINILKDGSATSIYGAKAMAGVIVITTKKGRPGSAKINYMGEFTMRLKPSYRDYNVMNSQDQMSVYSELADKGFLGLAETLRSSEYGVYGKMYELINTYNETTGQFGLPYTQAAMNSYLRKAEYLNTDWFDLLFNDSVMMNHSVSVSLGSQKASSYISMSVMDDPGWYKRSSVERYTFNANTTFRILDNLSFTLLANGSYRRQEAPGTLSQEEDAVFGEVNRDFDINPFSFAMNTSRALDPDQDYVRNYTSFNIFDELENNYMSINATDIRFQGELKWTIVPGLDFNSLASFRYTQTSMQHHIMDQSNQARAYREMSDAVIQQSNPFLYDDPDQLNQLPVTILPDGGIYQRRDYKMAGWDFRATANWNKAWGADERHLTNLFAGMEVNSLKRSNSMFRGWGMQYSLGELPSYVYQFFKKGIEADDKYYSLSHTMGRAVAAFMNATYSYDGRYTLNGTFRYEGTNRMGSSRSARWLPTWNISAAWNAHEEKFFKDLFEPALSHFTLKASYSLTADRGPASVTNSHAIFLGTTPYRPFASIQETGLYLDEPENSELTYEKKHELNIGAEMGFLNNRINFAIDWYRRNNYDLIGLINTSGVGGFPYKYANVASMRSHGVEFTLSTVNIRNHAFSWTSDLIFSNSKTKVTELDTRSNLMNFISGTGFTRPGYPVRSLFSIPFVGLDEDGIPQFEVNGEVTSTDISFQQRDNLDFLKYEGPTDPTITGSLGNVFTYKGFKLNVFLTYAFGNAVRLDPRFSATYTDLDAMPREFKNRWELSGEELSTTIPVILDRRQYYENYDLSYAYNAYNYSTERVAKGDFIRLKEISLGYDFPKKWISYLKMQTLSLKLQATNLMLLYADKKLNGQDPEFFNTGGVASPVPRQFTLIVRLGL